MGGEEGVGTVSVLPRCPSVVTKGDGGFLLKVLEMERRRVSARPMGKSGRRSGGNLPTLFVILSSFSFSFAVLPASNSHVRLVL